MQVNYHLFSMEVYMRSKIFGMKTTPDSYYQIKIPYFSHKSPIFNLPIIKHMQY